MIWVAHTGIGHRLGGRAGTPLVPAPGLALGGGFAAALLVAASSCGTHFSTGCEGRISVVKRRHGLNRCRYKGDAGMKRWVGLGVIADNLINIGRAMKRSVP